MGCDDRDTQSGLGGFVTYHIWNYPRSSAFHPEEERFMPYEIDGMYEIGNQQYMIAGPQYMIGAPSALMQGAISRAPQFVQARPAMQPSVAPQLVPVLQMPQPTIVEKRDPTQARLQPIGCNQETDIAVGATGIATVRPQKVFKPERFTVPDTVAPDFLITGIFVGVALQSPANNAIPAEAFLPTSIYSNVDFDTCQISQDLTVNARNRGGAARPFFSTFFGKALQ